MGQGRAALLGGEVSFGEMFFAEDFGAEDLSCGKLADVTGIVDPKGEAYHLYTQVHHHSHSTLTALNPRTRPTDSKLRRLITNQYFHPRIPRRRSMLNTYLGHGEREGWLLHTRIVENEARTRSRTGIP